MQSETNIKSTSHIAKSVVTLIFSALLIWWLYSFITSEGENNLVWAAVYQVIAAIGAINGFIASARWGGVKSLLGRTALFFALGLSLQIFGQTAFSYYNLVREIDIPYPSIADIGYFGSIPLYILATTLLLKVSGGTIALRSLGNKTLSLLLPITMLMFSYLFFLRSYEFDWSQPLNIFLDFGYPLGQATYVSIVILTYILSRRYLGGMMKNSILIILFALLTQYVADYNFLYQAYHGTWVNGGYGDLLYFVSYFVLTIGLIQFGQVFKKIKES